MTFLQRRCSKITFVNQKATSAELGLRSVFIFFHHRNGSMTRPLGCKKVKYVYNHIEWNKLEWLNFYCEECCLWPLGSRTLCFRYFITVQAMGWPTQAGTSSMTTPRQMKWRPWQITALQFITGMLWARRRKSWWIRNILCTIFFCQIAQSPKRACYNQ